MNGWKNRATWITNLHIGETLAELTREFVSFYAEKYDSREDLIEAIATHLEESVEDIFAEDLRTISNNLFLSDLFDFDQIDWTELAVTYFDDLEIEVIESSEVSE